MNASNVKQRASEIVGVWASTYERSLLESIPASDLDEIHCWMKDASPEELADVLRVAYQAGKRAAK